MHMQCSSKGLQMRRSSVRNELEGGGGGGGGGGHLELTRGVKACKNNTQINKNKNKKNREVCNLTFCFCFHAENPVVD